jgi:hypothetical protein
LDGTNYVPEIVKQSARLKNHQGEARRFGSDYRHGQTYDDAHPDDDIDDCYGNRYNYHSAGRFPPGSIR